MGGRLARGSGWVHEAVAGRPVGRSSLTERRPASAVRRALRRHRSRRVGALPRGHFHCGVSPSGGPAGRSDDMYSGLTSMPSAVCLVSSAAGSLPPSSLVARFVQRAGRLHRLRAERKGRMRRRNPGRRGVRGCPLFPPRLSHLSPLPPQMDTEYTQLPSAEAVAASAADSSSLLLAAAASTFGSHDPYSNSSAAPYAPHEGSHSSQSYEPVQAVVEAMAEHGAAASSVYQAQQATRKRGRPPGSKNKPHVGPSVDTQSHGVPQPRRRYRACACRRPAHRARLRHRAACPGGHHAQYARGTSLRRRVHTAVRVVHRRRGHRRRARDAVTTTIGTKASLRCRPTSRWYASPPSTRGRATPQGVRPAPQLGLGLGLG